MKKNKRIVLIIIGMTLLAGIFFFIWQSRNAQITAEYGYDKAWKYENELTWSVFSKEKKEVRIRTSVNMPEKTKILINGEAVPDNDTHKFISVVLNKGINSVTIISGIDTVPQTDLDVRGLEKQTSTGAAVLYDSYEAEDLDTTGIIADTDREYHTFASEASGRSYVNLEQTGQSISFKLDHAANALVVRYCIPDSADGKGNDDVFEVDTGSAVIETPITSKYEWVYGHFPWNNDPESAAEEEGHLFYDDVRILLDQTYPAGTMLTLKRTAKTESKYLLIDVIEAEEIPEALPQPDNALSICDFGAVAGDGADDAKAIAECIQKAASEGKEVYIPKGEYEIKDDSFIRGIPITEDGVIIRGAGMWYTVLRGDAAGFIIKGKDISLYDFSLIGDVTQRKDAIDPPAINLTDNTTVRKHITLQNLWIEHFKVGTWSNTAMRIRIAGCRIRNTLADGINLCGGTSGCMVEQNDLRNTGDDAIAVFSRGVVCADNQIQNNTVALPWLANHIALYGAKNTVVSNNLLMDSIHNGGGINISSNFSPQAFEGYLKITGNTCIRCGSYNNDQNGINGGIWFNTVNGHNIDADIILSGNTVTDSTFSGISFMHSGAIGGVTIEKNIISDSGTWALTCDKGCEGSITWKENELMDNKKGDVCNNAQNSFSVKEK